MSNSPPSPGPDLFFTGGECLTRFGVWVRRTDMDLESANAEIFTRNSDASATGRDGIIREWGPNLPRAEWLTEADIDPTRNRLQFSENLAQAPWAVVRAFVVSADVHAPDLRPTAQKLVESTAAANSHFTAQLLDPEPPPDSDIAFSIFVKAAERPGCTLIVSDAAVANGTQVNFNAVDGSDVTFNTFGAGFALVDSGSIPIGGGWFRLFMTCTTTGEEVNCRCSTNNGVTSVYDGDGVSGIYVWGGQTEVGLEVTAYQRTPRDTDRKPSLLLEDASTNGLTFSEELDNGVWTKTASSIDPDVGTAPDGLATADKLVESVTDAQHRIERTIPATTDDTDQTLSFFCHAEERTWIRVQTVTKDNVNPASFVDIGNGEVGIVNAAHAIRIRALPDGWFRIDVVYNIGNGGVVPSIIIGLALDDGDHTYQGDGTSGALVWGIQMEIDRGAASSYMATGGVVFNRAVESYAVFFPAPPQAMTVYCKFREGGSVANSASVRIFSVGETGIVHVRIFRSTTYRFGQDNGNGLIFTGNENPAPAVGDLVELRGLLFPDGSLQLGQTLNGGVESVTARTAGDGLAPEWSDQLAKINSVGDTGIYQFLAVKVQSDARTLDFMRSL